MTQKFIFNEIFYLGPGRHNRTAFRVIRALNPLHPPHLSNRVVFSQLVIPPLCAMTLLEFNVAVRERAAIMVSLGERYGVLIGGKVHTQICLAIQSVLFSIMGLINAGSRNVRVNTMMTSQIKVLNWPDWHSPLSPRGQNQKQTNVVRDEWRLHEDAAICPAEALKLPGFIFGP